MPEITGLWIPLEYLRNDLLTGNERLIVSYIKFRGNGSPFEGSNREICEALNMSKSRVSEGINNLVEKGFLERIDRHLLVSEKFRKTELPKSSENRNTEKVPKNGTISSEKRNIPEIIPYSNIKVINNDNNNAKKEEQQNEKTKKSSKVSFQKTSLPEVEFLDSEFKDFKFFEDYLQKAHPDIDTHFYYHKISVWIDKNTNQLAKRKIWKSTVNQFLENDYKKGELVTTKSKGHAKPTNNNIRQTNIFEQPATAHQLDDLISQYFAKE